MDTFRLRRFDSLKQIERLMDPSSRQVDIFKSPITPMIGSPKASPEYDGIKTILGEEAFTSVFRDNLSVLAVDAKNGSVVGILPTCTPSESNLDGEGRRLGKLRAMNTEAKQQVTEGDEYGGQTIGRKKCQLGGNLESAHQRLESGVIPNSGICQRNLENPRS